MPTTRYSLVTLSFITLIGLAGCNGSQPVRSSIDTESSPPDKSESSETLVAEWSWLKDSLLQADHDSTPTTKTWFYLDPYLPEASEASPDEENWRNTADSAGKRPEANVNTLAEIDLWTRIRQGFELTPVDNSLVRNQLKWYQENPDHLTQIEERARPYLYYIVEALEKRGLPMELALLPADYPAAFAGFAAGRTVRPAGRSHPRIQILGLLEARLQSSGLLILGGLNEGVWPDLPATDPWLSRPMRATKRRAACISA